VTTGLTWPDFEASGSRHRQYGGICGNAGRPSRPLASIMLARLQAPPQKLGAEFGAMLPREACGSMAPQNENMPPALFSTESKEDRSVQDRSAPRIVHPVIVQPRGMFSPVHGASPAGRQASPAVAPAKAGIDQAVIVQPRSRGFARRSASEGGYRQAVIVQPRSRGFARRSASEGGYRPGLLALGTSIPSFPLWISTLPARLQRGFSLKASPSRVSALKAC